MPKQKKKAETADDKRSEEQARCQLESLREMVKALNDAGDDDKAREAAEQSIQEDRLSVQVRYGWITPGHSAQMVKDGPEQFEILLCTGGPACRIIGELDQYNEPDKARIEHQDWGTPWTAIWLTAEEEADVLTYCRCFYFGE